MRSRNEVMTPDVTGLTNRELQSLRNQGNEAERAADMVFALEQNVARLENYVMQQDMKVGDLQKSLQRLKELNSEMFVSRCAAHQAVEAAEQDAARWRMLLQQHKHWLGVFRCDPDGAPSDSMDHVELKAMLDALIAQEPAREFECLGEPSFCKNPRGCDCQAPTEPHPSCKTPDGCRENGCLGWCDEHRPEGAKP